uniref:Uncharacterized protein n=1 Tax=Glossina palpalis gambiensis TaxID=67801 RepID=A0A1B0C6G2_9MUSC
MSTSSASKRGASIVVEGCERTGKSTHVHCMSFFGTVGCGQTNGVSGILAYSNSQNSLIGVWHPKRVIVFYMKMNSIDGLLERGNFGDVRYEKKEFKIKVSNAFEDIYAKETHYWHEIDAELPGDDVHKEIVKRTECFLKILTVKTLECMK